MFWKLIVLALLVWGVAFYMSFTFGGFIHLIPVGVVVFVVVRKMGAAPNTPFGRWRAPPTRDDKGR